MFGGDNGMCIQPWNTESDRLLCIKSSNVARLFISLLMRECDFLFSRQRISLEALRAFPVLSNAAWKI